MGTVGLSFGSPTSGAGFNVSTTVSEIMSNLQNVETPWKNQLTTINSQDAVFSSLGTILSNLSTDISNLTNATGILAEKEGASSDTNVLQLTAATSAAVAGTHSVTVANLATTASGYLNEITNASDTLAGSISIQVGSGAAQTITLNSSNNTLSGLAAAINSSGIGVTAAVLTDSTGSRLSIVSGTSGASGNLTIHSSVTDTTPAPLTFTGGTYTSTTAETGTLGSVNSLSDKITGSVVLQVGSGAAHTITMSSSQPTLTALENAINAASLGVTASIVTNSAGVSSISLASQTNGAAGALTVTSSLKDSTPPTLGYNSAVTGVNANINVDGVNLVTSSNTVSNLIPGVTFQLLAPSTTPVQVVISNYNSGVESTVNSLVTDYNSLVSAINAQQGLDSSGNAEPLFGNPNLSLLQQNILGGVNLANPNGYLDSISSTNGTTLSGSITIQTVGGYFLDYENTTASSTAQSTGLLGPVASPTDTLTGSISIGVGKGQAQTIQLNSSNNTLAGLMNSINTDGLGVTAALVNNADGSQSLSLTSQTAGTAGALNVDTQIRDLSSHTVDVPATSSHNTLSGLAAAINAKHIGVNASVVTLNGQSTLTLASHTEGSNGGALTVSSNLAATSPTALPYTGSAYTSTSNSSGTIGSIANASDKLSGSLVLQVGGGTAHTITLNSSDNTLAGLEATINAANLGVTASISTAGGQSSLVLEAALPGSAGALTVTSNIMDTQSTTATKLNYTNSSDINSFSTLGISTNPDGTISLNVNNLDSVLNSDYGSVQAFFQNANSWGQNFAALLTNAGTTGTGQLAEALDSSSSIESTLNADISREDAQISSESKSLTTELNSANEIMQALPTQLSGVNELYSAITGYNQSSV